MAKARGKDLLSKARRSWNMSRIRGNDTTLETVERLRRKFSEYIG